jgi:RNA polymerase sporulation-specific sigma factor
MAAARAATARSPQKVQRELEDLQLVIKSRNGDSVAMDALIRRYTGFVRLKASSYFLAGGDNDDLLQEGLIGLYKAVRDFRADKETSFRSFAELCVTRQIITAIKTATRFKHAPLNTYVSFSHTPAGQDGEGDCTLGDALPGPAVHEPPLVVISTEELQSLAQLGTGLLRRSRQTPCASISRARRTKTWPRSSVATRRRSTTRCSGSSARSSRTREAAKFFSESRYASDLVVGSHPDLLLLHIPRRMNA